MTKDPVEQLKTEIAAARAILSTEEKHSRLWMTLNDFIAVATRQLAELESPTGSG